MPKLAIAANLRSDIDDDKDDDEETAVPPHRDDAIMIVSAN